MPSTPQGSIPAFGHAVTLSPHLICTPNRPPIPADLVQKILKEEYVDMEEMLPDNFPTGESSSSKHKGKQKGYPVPSILAWAECFPSYMSVLASIQPARTPDLLAYTCHIIRVPTLRRRRMENLQHEFLQAGSSPTHVDMVGGQPVLMDDGVQWGDS